MKKLVSVLVILAVFSATVFAAPGSMALALDNSDSAAVGLAGNQGIPNEAGVLFTDVQAVALTREEAQAVEGEGPIGAVIGGFVGTVVGTRAGNALYSAATPANSSRNNSLNRATHAAVGAKVGAVIGGFISGFF